MAPIESFSSVASTSDGSCSKELLGQRDKWVKNLMDFSRRNRLIYYRHLKRGTLTLTNIDSEEVTSLLAGRAMSLSAFFPGGMSDQTVGIAKTIRSAARSNEEERGVQTLFIGLGFAQWKADDDGSSPNAPMYLVPISIRVSDRDGDMMITRSGDMIINSVMLAKLRDEYKIDIDVSFFDEGDVHENIVELYDRFTNTLVNVPGFSSTKQCVLGNFDYQKMAMVDDLNANVDVMAKSDLIAAIAGDQAARAKIAATMYSIEPRDLDDIPAHDEPFVLDADASQQIVLHSALRHPSHAIIEGPPGTGKSQTISNLIAALIAQGKRVLFVAEKRAALEVVYRRLNSAGLGHLALDLHGGDVKRKAVYDRLRNSDEIARSVSPVDGAQEESDFERSRRILNDYVRILHTKQKGYDLSVFEIFSRLSQLEAINVMTRWRGSDIAEFTMDRYRDIVNDLRTLSEHEDLVHRNATSPWAQCELNSTEDVASALDNLSRLQSELTDLKAEVATLFPESDGLLATVDDIPPLMVVMEAICAGVSIFGVNLCKLDIEALDRMLAPGRSSKFNAALMWLSGDCRKSLKQLKTFSQHHWPGVKRAASIIHNLSSIPKTFLNQDVVQRIQKYGTTTLISTMRGVLTDYEQLSKILRAKLPRDIGSIAAELEILQQQSRNASIVALLRPAETRLKSLRLGTFLREIFDSKPSPSTWTKMLEKAWLNSVLDDVMTRESTLTAFKGKAHDDVVSEFKRLDLARIKLMAKRIRRSAAERYFQAMSEFPGQKAAVRLELQKKSRHLPLRKLMLNAPDVVASIAPCIMASPLSVSQLLPARVLFDFVIFDEGSQILPEDAVPSIMRGKYAIIAGDPRQLPPTTFFAAGESEDDDVDNADEDSGGITGIASILELVSPFVEPRPLTWHYRSNDERLIAFSNTHIYGDRLLTLPSTGRDGSAITHEYVQPQLLDGLELSATAEIGRVVQLIVDHIEKRPTESLGVIAMGIKHARRLEEALSRARIGRADLDEFLSENREEPFFIKNLERVQGDERDAIILTIGYGPDRSGQMVYRFGPINQRGGERRLNVAITRARKRMTVVSSFHHHDLDSERLKSQGAKLLSAFVQYAESSGANLGREGAASAVEVNAFEQDVMDALTRRGLEIVPQYGVSRYRIDLAVKHPEKPGEFLLAIECDGATYHSAPTARNRDRLRQRHLEALGWKFHRIWSTDWFYDRESEIDRAVCKFERCLETSRAGAEENAAAAAPGEQLVSDGVPKRAKQKPFVETGLPVDKYSDALIYLLIRWIESDGLLRTDESLIDELVRELGYARRGRRIVERLQSAIRGYHRRYHTTG